jgi:hypothetical protein
MPRADWPGCILRNFSKDLYLTEIESWRHLQSQNYGFTMKRLREPIGD